MYYGFVCTSLESSYETVLGRGVEGGGGGLLIWEGSLEEREITFQFTDCFFFLLFNKNRQF